MEKTRTNFQSNRINTHESQGDAVSQTEIGLQADRHMDDYKYMDMEKYRKGLLDLYMVIMLVIIILSISKLPSLKLGRERSIATLTYKITHNLASSFLKDLITPTRNSKLFLPSFKSTRHGLNSFMYKAPRIWNTLPIPGFKVLGNWNGYTHMGS